MGGIDAFILCISRKEIGDGFNSKLFPSAAKRCHRISDNWPPCCEYLDSNRESNLKNLSHETPE